MGRAALGDTGHSWQVAAGESGTCTRGLRITRPEHSMFAALDSSPRVRLGPTTNTQGLPPNRLPILASQDPGMHAPFGNVLRAEVTCEACDRTIIHRLGRDRLVRPEARFLFAGRRLVAT